MHDYELTVFEFVLLLCEFTQSIDFDPLEFVELGTDLVVNQVEMFRNMAALEHSQRNT